MKDTPKFNPFSRCKWGFKFQFHFYGTKESALFLILVSWSKKKRHAKKVFKNIYNLSSFPIPLHKSFHISRTKHSSCHPKVTKSHCPLASSALTSKISSFWSSIKQRVRNTISTRELTQNKISDNKYIDSKDGLLFIAFRSSTNLAKS